MRIRRSAPSPVTPSCSSSCSSSSSCFSSISTHSLTSSSNSTSFSFSHSPNSSPNRCEGLDLLVKAVYHVAGSVVGVPYIQRRVIRRRKRALRFTNLVIGSLKDEQQDDAVLLEEREGLEVFDNLGQQKRQRRRSIRGRPSEYDFAVKI